jgi:hypothetical protein
VALRPRLSPGVPLSKRILWVARLPYGVVHAPPTKHRHVKAASLSYDSHVNFPLRMLYFDARLILVAT